MLARSMADLDAAEFFDAKTNRVAAQRCFGCARLRLPADFSCPSCRSEDWELEWLDPAGRIYTCTRICRPLPPEEDGPYWMAIIESSRGVKLVARLDVRPDTTPEIGDLVRPAVPGRLPVPVPVCELVEGERR